MSRGDFRSVQMGDFNPERVNFRAVGTVVGLGLLLLLALNSFFTVEPEQVGVVQRFGEFARETPPGLNFKIPFVERVRKVPVQRQLKAEFGFRTRQANVRSTYDSRGFEEESLMLTGDLNVADVEWIAQFRVSDPYQFLFRVRNPIETLRDMNEAVMRAVIGDRSVNEVLTVGRQEIASEVESRLQELCNQYEIGIRIEQIVLQDVNPPDAVKPSFNEVNQAQQERERMINEARAQFNREVPRARGEAQQLIEQAQGYATDRVNRAKGDAALFSAVLEAYRRAPEVTRRRIYLETMQGLMPSIKRKVILDEGMNGLLPLLNLDPGAK